MTEHQVFAISVASLKGIVGQKAGMLNYTFEIWWEHCMIESMVAESSFLPNIAGSCFAPWVALAVKVDDSRRLFGAPSQLSANCVLDYLGNRC